MTGWDWALAGVGLTLIAILLVIGAVAWVRDGRIRPTSRRELAELVHQVKQDLDAQRDAEWPRRRS